MTNFEIRNVFRQLFLTENVCSAFPTFYMLCVVSAESYSVNSVRQIFSIRRDGSSPSIVRQRVRPT